MTQVKYSGINEIAITASLLITVNTNVAENELLVKKKKKKS